MIGSRFTVVVCLLVFFNSLFVRAQAAENHPEQANKETEPAEHPLFYPDVEFLGSTKFRDATVIVPVWRRLNFEGHYFGDTEHDVGLVGGSWTVEFLKKITLAPGLAAGIGSHYGTAPAATLRWGAEHAWFHAEGFSSLSLRSALQPEEEQGKTHYTKHSYISDGNHISGRWKRIEGGFSWEHIATREDQEWKTGGRFDIALTRRLNFVAFILAPDTEFRCGLHFHPPEKDR